MQIAFVSENESWCQTMNYKQVRDILDGVRDCHRRFRDALADALQHMKAEDADEIVDAMRQREQRWQLTLAEYEKDGADSVLDTWVQFVPDEAIKQQLDAIHITSEITIDEIAEMAMNFHNALIGLYTVLAGEVTAPRVQQLFSSLLELEQTVAAEQTWSLRTL